MPRKYVVKTATDPYHITARCINRECFPIPLQEVWSISSDFLSLVAYHFRINIHSFVLMPNHFHLVASAPEGNISDAMKLFMGETSKEISRIAGRINQTWGGRHHKCLINNFHYYMNVYKYVYRNPVRANLCERVELYPYSSISGLLGNVPIHFPVIEDTLLFAPNLDVQNLSWLNTRSKENHEKEIKRALRKRVFKLAAQKERPSELETLLI